MLNLKLPTEASSDYIKADVSHYADLVVLGANSNYFNKKIKNNFSVTSQLSHSEFSCDKL